MTTTVPDEERGVLRDVSWQFYDRLSDAIGAPSPIRVAYDGKDMEIMNLGPNHERSKSRLGFFIYEVAMDRGLPVAEISAQFTPPWAGKFACDSFHPSQDGYRDWTRALLTALPSV